jgi:hypothetical protein
MRLTAKKEIMGGGSRKGNKYEPISARRPTVVGLARVSDGELNVRFGGMGEDEFLIVVIDVRIFVVACPWVTSKRG